MALRRAGHQLVLTHGNGPQVGLLALAMPDQPLDVLTAMTQGQIGYLLETAIGSVDPGVPTATLSTRVVVDRDDPAFAVPTKPVGPFYDGEQARRLAVEHGWAVADDAGRGWRRVVASPRPVEVLGAANARTLVDAGVLVIAGGGGGVPVDARARRAPGRRRQGPLLGRAGAGRRRRPADPAHRRAARGDRLRHALGARARAHHAVGRRARAGRRRVPGRQHGPEDRVGAALRGAAAATR